MSEPQAEITLETCLLEARRTTDEVERKRREAPYRNFIEGATAAGFTREQAEFLWEMRPRSEWFA